MSGFHSQIRLIVLTLLLVALAACQQFPLREPSGSELERGGRLSAGTRDLDQALLLLQEGEAERAEALLDQILKDRPADSIARLLLAQIQQPPEEMLGDQFQEIVVQPGDSLSVIAARHAGNELLFYSLARLNGVQRPRLLKSGQRLKVPVSRDSAPPDPLPESTLSDSAQGRLDSAALSQATDELISRGQRLRAYTLLLSAANADALDLPLSNRLTGLATELAEAALAEDDPERALRLLEQAAPWLGERIRQGAFAATMARAQARASLKNAGRELEEGDYEAARISFIRQAGNELEGLYRAEYDAVRSALIEHFHVRALSAWRSQKVDQAVSLWEQVLEIDAGFEPARIYLERGYRIQQQLDSLPEG